MTGFVGIPSLQCCPASLSYSNRRRNHSCYDREKDRDLTQPYDKSNCTHKKNKNQRDNTQTQPKTSIAQRLRTDLGRSVWVTIATQLAWLNRFTGSQPSQ